MRPFLDPAIQRDPSRGIMQVWRALMVGEMDAWVIDGEAQGYVITFEQDGDFWIGYAGGLVDGGPKRRLSLYRKILGNFEEIARQLGKPGVRFAGRDWHFFDGYVPTGALPNERRKAL